MREVLSFPQIDKASIETVKKLIDCIADKTDSDCNAELAELSRITGKRHSASDFAEYWGWTDLEQLAEKTLMAEPPSVNDLAQNEIEEIVEIIKECFVSGEDSKAEYYTELLHKSLPLANVMGYIMSEDDVTSITQAMITASSDGVICL